MTEKCFFTHLVNMDIRLSARMRAWGFNGFVRRGFFQYIPAGRPADGRRAGSMESLYPGPGQFCPVKGITALAGPETIGSSMLPPEERAGIEDVPLEPGRASRSPDPPGKACGDRKDSTEFAQ